MPFALVVPSLLVGSGLIFYLAAICIYRLFLHPVSGFPGPWLAKVTNLYAAYHAWKGDIHVDIWKCHQKYGSHVRYAPNRIFFDTHESLQDIYGYNSNVIKSSNYGALVHRMPNILTLRDKHQHGRRKKLISQGFSDANLRTLEPAILTQIAKFCDKLIEPLDDDGLTSHGYQDKPAGQWSCTRDLSRWCDYLTFDIMSSVIFSGKYDALGKPDFRWIPEAITASNVRVSVLAQAPELGFWRLDKKLFTKSIKNRNIFIKFVTKTLADRLALAKTEDPKDIFSFLAKAKDSEGGSALSLPELGAESTTLIVAGSDTTSTAMAGMLFYLSRYPAAMERAVAEVRQTFSSVDEIRAGAKLNSCKFFRACIDETLRITPSSGSAPLREVLNGGAQLDGKFIPEGVDVGVGIYAVQHNPDYFPEPFAFIPERWIED